MEKLKILFVSSEVVPFAKTGGLADVSGQLPRILAGMGHEVKVVMPRYGTIPEEFLNCTFYDIDLKIDIGPAEHKVSLCHQREMRLPLEYLFIENDYFFDRPELYRDPDTGKDYLDNDERFIFFSRAALEILKKIEWIPDIIHANDWQSALIPAYLATAYADDNFYRGIKTVFTIHNLAYQGLFPAASFRKLNLRDGLFFPTGPFEFYGKLNLMKAAIIYATLINTVSEKYAEEIQGSPEYGSGLEGVLRSRSGDLYGIINGVDYSEWSPQRDSHIPFKYDPASISGKRDNKVELVNRIGLPLRDHGPLVGIISRLADQKGFDLISDAADDLLGLDLQMVILGTGEPKYHELLEKLQRKYPDKLRVILKFDNALAHLIEAGADMFLMPSRYEPCGLNQLYSLKYGTVPIVRATGGLADTINDYNPADGRGNGFVFDEYDAEAMLDAVRRALAVYPKKKTWRRIMKTGMQQDYSWERSAKKYIELYQKALTKN